MRALNRKPIHPPRTIIDPATIVHEMRVLKSAEEIALMQKAADIAAGGPRGGDESACGPGMMEYEVEALIEQIFRRHEFRAVVHVNRRRRRQRHRAALHKQRR